MAYEFSSLPTAYPVLTRQQTPTESPFTAKGFSSQQLPAPMMIMEQRKSEGKQDDDGEDQEEEENAESSCTTMVATMVPRLEQG